MILCNGKQQSGLDRGLQFGDGHFTTMRMANGQPLWWSYHWQRLVAACQRLFMPIPQQDQLQQWLQAATTGMPNAVVKIIITRGEGGRGYTLPTVPSVNTYLSVSPLPAIQAEIQTLALASLTLARQPQLAGLKTLNRLEQVLLAQERVSRQVDDLLVCDDQQRVIECCQGNLFWRIGDRWFTPALQDCGIAGVARQVIMDNQWLGELTVGDFKLSHLYQAEQAFVSNSVRGAVPLRNLNDNILNTDIPDVLKQLTQC